MIAGCPLSQRDWAILRNHFTEKKEWDKVLWCVENVDDRFERTVRTVNTLVRIGGDSVGEADIISSRVIAEWPNRSESWHARGGVLAALGKADEALECFSKAVDISPHNPEYISDLAYGYGLAGDHSKSVEEYSKAIKLSPGKVELRTWCAMQQILSGDWANGLQQYEARLLHANPCPRNRVMWTGEKLSGKTICLYHEQGFGDAIQFIRYAPILKENWDAKRVIVRCRDSIYRLMRTAPGVDAVYTDSMGNDYPDYDYHLPIMSLMLHVHRVYGDRFREVVTCPYFYVPVQKPLYGKMLGLSWQGNTQHLNDRFRSINIEELDALVNDPEIHGSWVSLQHGMDYDEDRFPMQQILTTDFYDYAGFVSAMDHVVTVDTAVAHLAGALGIPVSLMLPANPDWRWGTFGDTTDWYPHMKIFRQSKLLNWKPVVEKVRESLWGDD